MTAPRSELEGGPAFPFEYDAGFGERQACTGMSLRDWFAGQALCSLPVRSWDHYGFKTEDELFNAWARGAYAIADAMLKARKESRHD